MSPKLISYGDSAILIQFETAPEHPPFSKEINQTIHALAEKLRQTVSWRDIVPGYDSLLCVFDLTTTSIEIAKSDIKECLKNLKIETKSKGDVIEIPVAHGGDYGPDMKTIMTASKLSENEVIKRHSHKPYDVCMMGFIPGFTFLSPAPKKLHHPRHATPRQLVPAGSVGIAGWQTGIYGLDSPGGWQIIGRTPLKLFDKFRKDPFLIKAGDQIRFIPILQKDFHEVSI